MTDKLTNEQWEEKARLAKIERLNWVIENIGKIAELLDLYGEENKKWDVEKLDCSFIDEWEEYSTDVIRICFWPYLGSNRDFDVKVHEEDLDKFIAQYLKWKGKKIVEDPEVAE